MSEGKLFHVVQFIARTLTIAVYIIGAFGFIGSVVVASNVAGFLWEGTMMTARVPNGMWFSDDPNTLDAVRIPKPLNASERKILLATLVFAIAYLNAAIFLIYAAMTRRSFMAYPWLICEAVTFTLQLAVVACPFEFPGSDQIQQIDMWKSIMFIFFTLYVILVIMIAQYEWKKERMEVEEILAEGVKPPLFITGFHSMKAEV